MGLKNSRWDAALGTLLTTAILAISGAEAVWIVLGTWMSFLIPLVFQGAPPRALPDGRTAGASDFVLLPVVSAGTASVAGLHLDAEWLLVWLVVPVVTAAAAWFRIGMSVVDPESPETSRVTNFCVSGLAAPGVAILVLVVTLTTRGTIADLGDLPGLRDGPWTSSPELLRGLVAIGAVLLATGSTLRVVFERREASRRRRVSRRYRRLGESLVKRLDRTVEVARTIRTKTTWLEQPHSHVPGVPRATRLAVERRALALRILDEHSHDYPTLLDEVTRLDRDLRSVGALSVGTDGPLELPEHLKLVRELDPSIRPLRESLETQREAVRSLAAGARGTGSSRGSIARMGEDVLGHRLDAYRLLGEEDDLNACMDALRSISVTDASEAPRRSLAEHLARRRLGPEFLHEPRRSVRPITGSGERTYLLAGVATLVPLPLILSGLATDGWLDARWLDTVLSVCAVVGAALLTLYAVLREASLGAVEGTIEDAVESAGRISVLCSALERALERPIATFATHAYVIERALGMEVKSEEVLATHIFDPDEFTSAVDDLLEWAEGRRATSEVHVHFLPRARLRSAQAGGHTTRLRRARVLRFELAPDERDDVHVMGFRLEYNSAAYVPDEYPGIPGKRFAAEVNRPGALHLVLADGAPPTRDRFLALGFEPQRPLEWEPWDRMPTILPAVLGVPVDGRLQASTGVLEIAPSGPGAVVEDQRTRATRSIDAIRRESERLQLRQLWGILSTIEDSISDPSGQDRVDLARALERLSDIRDALLQFQDRNIFPLERFIGRDGTITSEADVLEFVLEELGVREAPEATG